MAEYEGIDESRILRSGIPQDVPPRRKTHDLVNDPALSAEQVNAIMYPPESQVPSRVPTMPTDQLAAGLAAQGAGSANLGRGFQGGPAYDKVQEDLRKQSGIARLLRMMKRL